MSKTAGPTTEKRRQDELDWEDEREEEDRSNEPRACEAFEVDLAAREFGTCKCGFKKQDHIQGYRAGPRAIAQPSAFSHDPSPRRSSLGSETEDSSAATTAAVAACDSYVIDMSAAEFGTCKCGQKKTSHTKQAIFAKPKTSGGFATLQAQSDRDKEEKLRDQERERKRKEEEQKAHAEFLERERKINGDEYVVAAPAVPVAAVAVAVVEEAAEDIPQCAAYELDLQAAKFGTCKCGQAKTAHTREALNAKPQHSSGVHRSSVTAHDDDDSAGDSGPKACDAFELDMSAAEFGTCKCGFKKTLHSKDALFAKPPTSRPSKPAPAFAQAKTVAAPAPVAPKAVAAPKAVVAPVPVPVPVAHVQEPEPELQPQHGGEMLDPPHVYRALFDFEGQEAEDLPFREGDLIEVVEVIDQDWLRGRIGSTIGVFPRDYAELYQEEAAVAAAEAPVEQVVVEEPVVEEPVSTVIAAAVAALEASEFPFVMYAQFDFESENEGDLALRMGDAVTVLEYVDEQWWRGQANGHEGIFPADFVGKEQPPMEDVAAAVAADAPAADAGLGFVIAQFDFVAENEGDLSFNQGDRIQVLELIDDNWMRGALNGNEGILPVSYVGEVTH